MAKLSPYRCVCVLLIVCTTWGCAGRTEMRVNGRGSFEATPAGPSAVLRVTSECPDISMSGHTTWGVVNTPQAAERFAELVAHAADEAGMNVMHPQRAAERLQAAALSPTLQPTDQQLAEHAVALGCASYLVGDIRCWKYRYLFFWETASIEFSLSCHAPGTPAPLWRIDVCNVQRGATDREVALNALRKAFRALKDEHYYDSWSACPE